MAPRLPSQAGGRRHPPPNIPGEHTPTRDPCPSACEGGVHCCRGREKAHFSTATGVPAPPVPRFCRFHDVFAQFSRVSTVSDVNGPFLPTFSRFSLRYHVFAIPIIVFAQFSRVPTVSDVKGTFLPFSDV